MIRESIGIPNESRVVVAIFEATCDTTRRAEGGPQPDDAGLMVADSSRRTTTPQSRAPPAGERGGGGGVFCDPPSSRTCQCWEDPLVFLFMLFVVVLVIAW